MNTLEFIEAAEKLFYEEETATDTYIINRLANQRTKLVRLINQLDQVGLNHFHVQKETVIRNVRELYDVIIGSVTLFLKGQFGESQQRIYNRFFDRANRSRRALPARGFDIGDETSFFRLRSSRTYNLYEKKEMFHIPFEKRGTVGNQRFSISGYPCLYLGSSIYCCWEETNRPNVDMFNVVSLKHVRPLSFIDLTIPTIDPQLFDEESVYQLVLPLACSLRVINNDDTFKSEYIIPQNVLSCIIKRNPGDIVSFDGVMYTSSTYGRKQCLFSEKSRMTNYVIPIKTCKKIGLCDELIESFHLTEPTSMLIERMRENVRDVFLPYGDEAPIDVYHNTTWGMTEELLLNREHIQI